MEQFLVDCESLTLNKKDTKNQNNKEIEQKQLKTINTCDITIRTTRGFLSI